MTRLPTESRDYTALSGDEYPDYKVGPTCAAPGCGRLADHAHHIVRRSELGGAYSWVRMPDGAEVGNLTGLCFRHHQLITENKASIIWWQDSFFWAEEGEKELRADILVPQPPRHDEPAEGAELSGAVEEDRPVCPGCGRKLPKPKIETPREDKKPRGTWAVAIPMDERENGADVLDGLLDGIHDKLDSVGISYSEGSQARYYVLSTGLALLLQHFDQVTADE